MSSKTYIAAICFCSIAFSVFHSCTSSSVSSKTREHPRQVADQAVADDRQNLYKPGEKPVKNEGETEIPTLIHPQARVEEKMQSLSGGSNSVGLKLKKTGGGSACMAPPAAFRSSGIGYGLGYMSGFSEGDRLEFNTEQYDRIHENQFVKVIEKPLSTFSIDVDAASYSNIRRFLNSNALPPKDAVRIEEMINYFTYDYPQPHDGHPFSITSEMGNCPWNKDHKVVLIGLQGKKIDTENLPPTNLTFLIDVSGSMQDPDKLPLLKKALRLLVDNLRSRDRVAITVYAGAAGQALESTPGSEKAVIINAIERLEAGGSTAGAEGIVLAYDVARKNFLNNGNNRVILCTDGDFNVGVSSDGELERLIEEKRKNGIFLTVLGFGTGNYKDSRMEKLADKGNGNYAYIDNLTEAKKVLVSEMGGTLFTIAKDVKIQVEFNPAKVQAYRLIGYENRALKDQEFNDDKKDAGELGAGHTVTALYEIVPVGVKIDIPGVDPLKYQATPVATRASGSDEVLTVKFRYKEPKDSISTLITETLGEDLRDRNSENFQWASAVAGFGMLLRDSENKGDLPWSKVLATARGSRGNDPQGYRAEMIRMIEQAEALSGGPVAQITE
jgi:Ca-activated chloride channel family protein